MFTIEKRSGYVYFEYPGEYNFKQVLDMLKEINRVIAEENAGKVLVYFQNVAHEVTMTDRFNLAVQGAASLRSSVHIACVFNTKTLDRFAENVAVNRGLNVRLFNDMQEALAWLNVENKNG